MYGMLYRLQPKQGRTRAVTDALFRWEQEILPTVTGFVGGYVFQPTATSAEIAGIFLFASQADVAQIRSDPAHIEWDQHLLPLVESTPQCSEGEFIEFMKELRGL